MKSIRARLIVWNVVVIGLVLGSMGIVLRYQLRAKLVGQIDSELAQELTGINAKPEQFPELLKSPDGKDGADKVVRERVSRRQSEHFFEVVKNNSGQASLGANLQVPRLIAVNDDPSHGMQPEDPAGFRGAKSGARTFHDFTVGGVPRRSISEPVYSNGRIFAVAQSSKDLRPVNREMNQLDLVLAMLLPLGLVVAAGAGTLLVGSAMRPIRRLTEAARNLDPDLSGTRLPTEGGDEFAELACTFNLAFDRTAQAFETQRRAMRQLEQFTANAGHELRTPLGAVKGSASFLLQSRKWGKEAKVPLEIIDAASDRMNLLIQDMLLLARIDGEQPEPKLADVRVSDALQKALLVLTKPDCVELQVCVEPDLIARAEELGLVRVMTNLVSNAFAYARTRVRISALAGPEGLAISVEDDGEGIAPEHLPRIGERFYRPESARGRADGGTGLGIAIAKSLVERYGGSLKISSTVHVGTKVVIHLGSG